MMNNIQKRKQEPKNRLGSVILTLLFAVCFSLGVGAVALASDTSDATYYGIIRMSNNSTAATNVAANFSLNTQELIDGNYINSSCNNTAVLTPGDADTAYMPAPGSNTSWVVWVSSIGLNTNLDYTLYTGGDTDMAGKIRYFPGNSGITTTDNASLELGDNFTFEQKGWWNTSSGSNKYAVAKSGTCENVTFNIFEVYVSGEGEITATVANYTSFNATSSGGYIRKYTQPTWEDAHDAAVGSVVPNTKVDTMTQKDATDNYTVHRGFMFFDTSALDDGATISSVILALYKFTIQEGDDGHADFHIVEGVQHDPMVGADFGDQLPYITSGGYISYDDITAGWNILEFNTTGLGWIDKTGTTKFCARLKGDSDNITPTGTNRIRFYGSETPSLSPKLLVATSANYTSVTATGITSGEYTIKVTADTDNLSIYVDDVLKDTCALSGNSLIDNSENWTFLQNGVMPYMEYQKIWVDGVLQQHIEWENTSGDFTDLSGNSHDATPTYRTDSSDADVSAELITFTPVSQSEAADWTLTEVGTMVGNVTAPGGLYAELGTANMSRIPFVGGINDIIDNTGMPRALFWMPVIFLFICIVGLMIGRFSLIAQLITMGTLMFLFAGAFLPPMMGILFLVDGAAIVVASKQFGW